MEKVNYAAIDIDSNTVRSLIRCVNEENAPELVSEIQLIHIPLRPGKDASTMGVVSTKKEKKLIRLIKAYKQLMEIYDMVDYRVCAISAMRDARNGKGVTRQAIKKTGIRVEITDGQEEARIAYDNYIEQLFASGQNYLYVDVGGGSTEINLTSSGGLKNSRSYNIDTVRVPSGMVEEEEEEALYTDLIGLATEYTPISIIGSGGNISRSFRLTDKKNKEASLPPIESLQDIYETLKALSTEQRIKQYKLKPDRADVTVPAAEVFLEITTHVKTTGITVPTIRLSDDIIDSLYMQNMSRLDFPQSR